MKYISLSELLSRLEEMKTAHPEFSPLLSKLAKDADKMASIMVPGGGMAEWVKSKKNG